MSSNTDPPEGFQKICSINDLIENRGKRFIVSNIEIAVFLVNNQVYALNNICPHKHSALIYDGFVEGEFVICPAHGWMFSLKSGKTPKGSKGLDTYECFVVEDQVFVKVEDKKYLW